ncbi:GNAT family N-acetyltransferase [Corallococcus sp. H22C18031201]|uniref:GNAT family N-acetyltransferase n=1 Tax=Citreicoccus inhibens TaxID=2849499 RepID=UPI000E721707|nr:GNAT family N-acetyltransferase [Citreicoccus inhibens]MBU8899608.1 GNAT family N-acetyltransferase [Citreicoccus inhibens]RJS27409.1 GNAT family N-acetyltransferase [Corallococcus sp. H22C18031201]
MSTPLDPSSIDTERLTLRRPRLEDFEEALAMWGDPEVTRYITGKAATREEMWSRLLRYVGHWELMGYGFWVVREKSTGRFAGEVGLADFRRDIELSFDGAKEMGWVLSSAFHGKGFATEAITAALKWVEGRFGPERVVCIIDPANEPSRKVALKVGFRECARGSYKGSPTVMYERLPSGK